jgi:xanthine dehydrogenase accessory factor
MELSNLVILIRGGGEVASGVAHKLARAHFRVCMTEVAQPMAVSRGVAFSEAIYDGEKEVEGVIARHVESTIEIAEVWRANKLPIMVDPEASLKDTLNPQVLVDAIMAKRNLGTRSGDAPLVIGLGPGFQAGKDVDIVIETNNSERLGRVILKGAAEENTSEPIVSKGMTYKRVLHSPIEGLFTTEKGIGDMVAAGEVVATVAGQPVKAKIGGVVRALLRSGAEVDKGTKLGEIDPSSDKEVGFSIRPRVRTIAGGVLEAILMHLNG